MMARSFARVADAGLGRHRLALLAGLAAAIWCVAYVQLALTPAEIDEPVARALRRLITHGAGLAICLGMIPLLGRLSMARPSEQVAAAAAVSLGAWASHYLVRIGTFHLVDPLWGPLSGEVFWAALHGAGWMFPLWSAVCLGVMNAAQREPPTCDRQPAEYLWCLQGGRRVRVRLDEVTLFEAEGDYVQLHTPGRRYLVRARLNRIEALLPPERFARVHRSFIARLDAIEALDRRGSAWRIEMRDGAVALVSRKLGSRLKSRLHV